MRRLRGFASVQPLVFVSVVAVAVVAGKKLVGSAWWMIALYVLAGMVVGAPLSVAAHYHRMVEVALVAGMLVALVLLL